MIKTRVAFAKGKGDSSFELKKQNLTSKSFVLTDITTGRSFEPMNNLGLILIFIVVWVLIVKVVFPRLGIQG